MTTIGIAFPAQIFVAQAEVRLVAHETAKAEPKVIQADKLALADALQSATEQSDRQPQVDIVT
jgi:hypothetical protein